MRAAEGCRTQISGEMRASHQGDSRERCCQLEHALDCYASKAEGARKLEGEIGLHHSFHPYIPALAVVARGDNLAHDHLEGFVNGGQAIVSAFKYLCGGYKRQKGGRMHRVCFSMVVPAAPSRRR